MSRGQSVSTLGADVVRSDRLAISARLADYVELSKLRIGAMVLLTVTVGFVLGSRGQLAVAGLAGALAGIGLVAAAGGALNQLIERRTDARMPRTADRPLASGRLQPAEAAAFGFACGATGVGILGLAVNGTTALLALLTLGLYVGAYTPLKRYTALSTAVGAIPGALPPVLGWSASGAELGWGAFSLFAVLFLWQFPHFLAIAWLYRRDYASAGLRMLPGRIPARGVTGLLACVYAAALIPVSLLPAQFALAGQAYRVAAVALGAGYLGAAAWFAIRESREAARGLLYCSLVYLPTLLLVLTWDFVRLSN